MVRASAFWDASALVPLCVHETTSPQARSQLRKYAQVVWWGSLVEVTSAICRSRRKEQITGDEKQTALRQLAILSDAWKEILPADPVRELAAGLLDTHPLRAADALQLAAALIWCGEHPSGRPFLSGDQRLSVAAQSAGFRIIGLI